MLRIEVAGVEEVSRHLFEVPKKVEAQVLRDMSQYIYDKAQAGADKHTKTGALLQSLYNRNIPGGREIGHDPQRAPHAVFVHWGTKPHVIKPKDKQSLRYPGRKFYAGWVFAKVVHHPGYKGDHWLTRAADDAVRNFDSIVQNALRKV